MRVATCTTTIALITCSLFAVALASADTMTITYRSGKVQKIDMDEPSTEVQGISYLRTSGSSSEFKAKESTSNPPAEVEGSRKEPAHDTKKPGVSIKWAPPIDE